MKKFTLNPILLLFAALFLGVLLGLLQWPWLSALLHVVASVFTRLFQLLAIPTIFLAVVNTLSSLGQQSQTGSIFRHTLRYTLLTTLVAALVGLTLFLLFPFPQDVVPFDKISSAEDFLAGTPLSGQEHLMHDERWLGGHILRIIPSNIFLPFLEGNVLSVLLIAVAVGLLLSTRELQERCHTLVEVFGQLQELLFAMIRVLVRILPLGIVAFSAQLSEELGRGVAATSLGHYLAVILAGNAIQVFMVLPVFLLLRGQNPIRVARAMMPALLMALFTKSSVATLPVTMQSAEERLGVQSRVARFVLPICTTINMNGCAAFILVTSLYVMQCGGLLPSMGESLPEVVGFYAMWVVIAVIAAVGNAGVPMGCYFLTFSLVSGIDNAPVALLGLILPLYTVIDMFETAENVWSDSCVCAMTDHDFPSS